MNDFIIGMIIGLFIITPVLIVDYISSSNNEVIVEITHEEMISELLKMYKKQGEFI